MLIDTHVALWWLAADRRLSTEVRRLIEAADRVRISVVSLWEVLIKAERGRLDLPAGYASALLDDFVALDLTADHVLQARSLPAIHRDPFDRMLIAQAIVEGLTIVSADADIARYPVVVIPA